MHLNITYLYPHSMSTYGDIGNIICLEKRCSWRSITTTIHHVDIGETLPPTTDIYFFGGGQDIAQEKVALDLKGQKDERIKNDSLHGTPLLAICGGYQLLGNSYIPFDGNPIAGSGLFPVITKASNTRMIGDVAIKANPLLNLSGRETLVGFENHSGKTYFTEDSSNSLGTIIQGNGNNGSDKTEGCIIHNAIGCYLHGSLLPKNPHLADWLITQACLKKDPSFTLTDLDNSGEWDAHTLIVDRYA